MSGKFVVYQDSAGKFRFLLKASNGEVVASGQGYSTKASARRGCESVLKAAEGAPVEMAAVAAVSAEASDQNGSVDRTPARDAPTSEGQTPGATDSVPARSLAGRHFRFSGGMAADHDLAARSGDVLRAELRQDR